MNNKCQIGHKRSASFLRPHPGLVRADDLQRDQGPPAAVQALSGGGAGHVHIQGIAGEGGGQGVLPGPERGGGPGVQRHDGRAVPLAADAALVDAVDDLAPDEVVADARGAVFADDLRLVVAVQSEST